MRKPNSMIFFVTSLARPRDVVDVAEGYRAPLPPMPKSADDRSLPAETLSELDPLDCGRLLSQPKRLRAVREELRSGNIYSWRAWACSATILMSLAASLSRCMRGETSTLRVEREMQRDFLRLRAGGRFSAITSTASRRSTSWSCRRSPSKFCIVLSLCATDDDFGCRLA